MSYVFVPDATKTMRVRPHRGLLDESMAEEAVVPKTLTALVDHINSDMRLPWFEDRLVKIEDLELHEYGYDDRIDWHSVLVKIKHIGVWGFLDDREKDQL